ncbi:hypothetical protein [Mesorhizobium carmichaelinearum]|uniref:hypothetical protein n=1 Tax=Mesorhizobium carmichaelinearum TaxID=1208188 RepID=UPI000BA2F4C8|nr:hypothetical protein [Mesorhizobium carmichaelinearum]
MRILFFALFMVLIPQLAAAASPPESGGQAEQAKPEQHQQTPATSPPISQPPVESADKPENPNPPCEAGQDNRNSDLCAQWKAADAAKESADWTMRSYWLVLAGTIIGACTLIAAGAAAKFARDAAIHTEAGAKQAERSAKAAEDAIVASREIGEAQARAYISVTKAWYENNANALPKIIIQVRNSGQSPAYDLQAIYRPCTEPINVEPPLKPLKVSSFPLTDLWPAGADEMLSFGVHPDDVVDPTGKGAPGKNFAMVELILEYMTVFDRQRGRIDMDTAVRLFIPNVPKWTGPDLNQTKPPRHPVAVMTSFTAGWIHEYRRTVGNGRRVIKKGEPDKESGTE